MSVWKKLHQVYAMMRIFSSTSEVVAGQGARYIKRSPLTVSGVKCRKSLSLKRRRPTDNISSGTVNH